MKVLMINTVPTERNGITAVIFNLLRAMDLTDLRIDYLAINQPAPMYETQIAQAGGKLITLRRSIANPMRYLKDLRKVIGEEKYDIVHVHGNSATMVLEMIAARQAGCKVRIAHSHNTTCTYMAVHKLLKPVFLRLCTHRLACSESAGKWLFPGRSFTVVNNGIDTKRFAFDAQARQQLRRQLGIGEDCRLLGHVGLFNDAKNQGFLIDLLKELADAGEPYKLVLVGQGNRKEAALMLSFLSLHERQLHRMRVHLFLQRQLHLQDKQEGNPQVHHSNLRG